MDFMARALSHAALASAYFFIAKARDPSSLRAARLTYGKKEENVHMG
jgi:hypothetical protein